MRRDKAFRQELENAVDFNAVLEQIAGYASFSCSVGEIVHALPKDDLRSIRQDLSLAQEALDYTRNGGDVSLGGLHDIHESVVQADKGVSLNPAELLEIGQFLEGVKEMQKAFKEGNYPLFTDLVNTMDPCSRLCEQIMEKIDLSGQIRDDATPALRSLHHKELKAKADLAAAGRSFVKRHADSLMDNITTEVGGRLCVLVKASDKNKFGGMIHGSSQSGQAFYIEVGDFVVLNNEVQACAAQIEEEKKKICRELSRLVKQKSLELDSDLETMTMLDTALAKGRWAAAHDGCIPIVSSEKRKIVLEHAVHPLLDAKSAVANTYTLEENQNCLMISGPNMGGKTVTLKTIGLFAALAQAGFPVSAHRALLPYYEQMFFDIGDNQSIEHNLSTFSSHISKMAQITDQATDKTFVLLDEAGNGTDPLEGASIAQSVLEYLIDKRATVITSTHYNELKAYGKSDNRILVSSVEFDPETLRPTYRYLPGISGASYAFDIASQLHLKPEILERAQDLKKENESEVQKQLENLEKLQQKTLARKDKFDALIADAHRLQKEADQEKQKWEKKKKQLDEDYNEQLEAMLDKSKEEAKEILADMRKARGPVHEQIAEMRKLDEMKESGRKKSAKPSRNTSDNREFKVGDYVHIEIMNAHGEIVELSKKKAVVLSNGKKIQVSPDNLTHMARPRQEKQKSTYTGRSFKAFPLELNIIGMRVDEGLQALDHYLDQAVVHNIKNVRIIHGMGTGALRNAVWQDLSKRNTIKSYTAGGPSDGGLGATLVEFK